jgi:hypothetical protein
VGRHAARRIGGGDGGVEERAEEGPGFERHGPATLVNVGRAGNAGLGCDWFARAARPR